LYLGHKSHYYYLLYLFTLLFVEALTTGADTLYIPSHVGLLWEWMEPLIYPEHPEYRIFLEVRWYILIMVYFLFIRSYLDLDKLMPVWDKIMKGMIALGGVYTLISLFIIRQTNYDVLLNDDILASYVGLFFLSVIIFLFFLKKTGDPRGKFVIWGFSVIIVSASPTLIDIIVHDMPSGYADTYLIVGLFIEKIIFTAALSFRQRTIEQTLSIRTEEQKRILAEQNKKLEDTVAERTHELLKKTEELEKSMLKQKEAQSRMIDQEKMASLGQLTAGIAHEINNPINFVSSNIDSLWLDMKDLEEMLRKMKAAAQERKESEAGEELLSIMEGEDADFLFKEIEGLIEGIQHGAERTQEIVKGLRTFSRLDEAGFKYADIHAGLDATLRILKVQMGKKIRVHKEYGDLPEVKCRHGKMNQVFMNILSNAIQALEGEGDIWITTEELRGEIIISIKDSGKGMSKEVQKRIFEPFYTTKKIGEGTGLGMFISHGVIQNHKGYIEVISEEGKGTEFIIQIPVDPEQLEEK
ncbi:MAG: ATP-binding protein, partial [Bacteroidota bacterium]